MSWHEKINRLNEIPDGNYEGYLWLSDEEMPRIITEIDSLQYEENGKPKNPFIREAYLYDGVKKISISVRHLPGRYLINSFYLENIPKDSVTEERALLANSKIGAKLLFKEVWLPEADENCEGFEVLRKKAVVFCGIGKEN